MEADARGAVEFIVYSPVGAHDSFRDIWHFDKVQIAKTDDGYWLKGFSAEQLRSVELRSIPKLRLFELKNQMLYLVGNKVPERKFPVGVLWHSIQQALRLELPSFNENLFDINGNIHVELTTSSEEHPTKASLVSLNELETFMSRVPSNEYSPATWCLFDQSKALVLSTHVFPMVSDRYWEMNGLFIPVGYTFKYSYLQTLISQVKQVKAPEKLWVFDQNGDYTEISNESCQELTRGSLKLTLQKC